MSIPSHHFPFLFIITLMSSWLCFTSLLTPKTSQILMEKTKWAQEFPTPLRSPSFSQKWTSCLGQWDWRGILSLLLIPINWLSSFEVQWEFKEIHVLFQQANGGWRRSTSSNQMCMEFLHAMKSLHSFFSFSSLIPSIMSPFDIISFILCMFIQK